MQSYIKEAQRIVVRSSRSDKYDRYLADVFVPAPTLLLENGTNTPRAQQGRAGVSTSEAKKDVYLNNLLLENNHAVRMS